MLLSTSVSALQILVADSDVKFSESVASVIRGVGDASGINITIVNTAQRTLEELASKKWHIIFIDAENSFPLIEPDALEKQITPHLLSPILIFLFHSKKNKVPEKFSTSTTYSFSREDLHANLIEVIVRTAKENLRQNILLETTVSATNHHAIVAVTDPDGKMTHVNDRFCSVSEYSREQLIGQNHHFLSSGYHPKEFFTEMWQTIKAGRVWHGDIKNISRSGKAFWLQTTIIPFLNESGVISSYVTVRTDVTKIKEQNDEALKKVVQGTNFLANVSHEIRTPIHVIQGIANLLSERKDEDPGVYLQTLKTAASSLKTMVDDLLDYTKFGSSRVTLEHLPTKIETCVHYIGSMFSNLAKEKGVELIIKQPLEMPDFLTDPNRLQQILVNLIANAIKFTDHGSVTIDIKCQVSVNDRGMLTINVSDTGIGIGPSSIPHLFLPFVQADASVSRRFGGTGLGLAITKSLVELMNGSIDVTSTEGVGSKFSIQIPIEFAKAKEAALNQSKMNSDGEYIVIDDDNLCSLVTVAMLKKIGIDAVAFSDGQSALDYIKSKSVSAVFVDNHLPDMTGKDVAKYIRALGGSFATIPVIALTGDSAKDYDYRSDGFSNWLVKPVSEAQFIESILRR